MPQNHCLLSQSMIERSLNTQVQSGTSLVEIECYQSQLDTNFGFRHLDLQRNCYHFSQIWVARVLGCPGPHDVKVPLASQASHQLVCAFGGRFGFFSCLAFSIPACKLSDRRCQPPSWNFPLAFCTLFTQFSVIHFIYSKKYFWSVTH